MAVSEGVGVGTGVGVMEPEDVPVPEPVTVMVRVCCKERSGERINAVGEAQRTYTSYGHGEAEARHSHHAHAKTLDACIQAEGPSRCLSITNTCTHRLRHGNVNRRR